MLDVDRLDGNRPVKTDSVDNNSWYWSIVGINDSIMNSCYVSMLVADIFGTGFRIHLLVASRKSPLSYYRNLLW